jgi:hypothetical protein
MSDFRPRIKGQMLDAWNNLTRKERRILVIGDLHEPFCLDGYLDFCKDTYRKHNCNQVIFIGDCIDSHYSSFHETDPDGMGGGEELELAIKRLSKMGGGFPSCRRNYRKPRPYNKPQSILVVAFRRLG